MRRVLKNLEEQHAYAAAVNWYRANVHIDNDSKVSVRTCVPKTITEHNRLLHRYER